MYVPSNIIRLPNIVLIPDQINTGGAGTKATFTNAQASSSYSHFDLEENTNYTIEVDTTVITVTKKTLVRATLKQYTTATNQSYLYGIFDNTSNTQLGCQGGYGYLNASYGTPNGGALNNYHNSADAIIEANTSFYLKIVSVSPSGGGVYAKHSKVYLFQLEP